ncbi:MAG: FAD-dependent monooxygenase [Coxiellaceae bacterium]|nr:FAD-dependent monooxygenase [Coxiellaceae bacterium]
MKIDTPVLIIGAGPVGLTMAAFLDYHDVPCRIIDKKSGPTTTSNAVGIHARTLELLKPLGILDELMKYGKKMKAAEVGCHNRTLAEWQLDQINSEFPFALCVPQWKTEEILINHLSKRGITVERDCNLITIEQDSKHCTAYIKGKKGEITINSNWLIACDGFHSKVRECLPDIKFEGEDMKLRFLMIDAPVESDHKEVFERITAYTNGGLTVMLFPMLESMRIVAEVSHDERYNTIEKFDEKLFNQFAEQCLPYQINIQKPLWTSKFWIHERLANHYRSGHVFLAGDAGHAHSPAGGQGMNTGMQDAINLAWKLALVYHCKADEKLLDSYEQERRPVAKQVIDNAGRLTKALTSNNPVVKTVRNTIVPLLAAFAGVQRKMVNEIGETSICYTKSNISKGEKTSETQPGDLCPLFALRSNNECVLLDFNGDAKINGVKVQAGTTEQAQALGLTAGGYCLIRPDGYIAYIGHEMPTVEWLSQ